MAKLAQGTNVYGSGGQLIKTTKGQPQNTTSPMAVERAKNATQVNSSVSDVTTNGIKAENLKTDGSTYSPPPAPMNTGTEIAVNTTANKVETATTQAKEEGFNKDSVMQYLKDTFEGRDNLGEQKAQLRADAGIAQKEERARKIGNEITATKRSYENKIEQIEKNSQGKFGGAIADEVDDLRRKGNRELADLAIQYEVANGDYQAAEKIVTQQIADIESDYDNKIDTLKTAYNFLMNDLSESEKQTAQQNFQLLQDEKQFERQKALASYNATLDRDTAAYKAGLEQDNQVPTTFKTPLEQAQAQSNISQVQGLLDNNALSNAVAPSALGRFTINEAFTGRKANFIADVEQLRTQLTLDSLLNAKARGATFGALSEGELHLLNASATKIGTWAVEKDGRVVGYSAKQEDFKRELDKINNFAKIDYIAKGGAPEDVGAFTMLDETVWTKNSDGTLTQLK